MAASVTASDAATAALSDIETRIKDDNKAFFLKNQGFTRPQLHGHRIRAAYLAMKAFVSAHQEHSVPDFEERLLIYARLLLREMVRSRRIYFLIQLTCRAGGLRDYAVIQWDECYRKLSST